MNILQNIAAKRQSDIENRKQKICLEEMRRRAESLAGREKAETGGFAFPFEQSLSQAGMSFICEIKKASPSKGIITEAFDYLEIAEAPALS